MAQLRVGRGGEARRSGLEHSAQMSTFVLSAAVPGRGGGETRGLKGVKPRLRELTQNSDVRCRIEDSCGRASAQSKEEPGKEELLSRPANELLVAKNETPGYIGE